MPVAAQGAAAVLALCLSAGAMGADSATKSPPAAGGSGAGESQAPADPAGNATIESAIAQLNAPKYSIRDWAQHYLMQQSPDSLPVIEKALDSAGDAETAMRLSSVAMHLFLKGRTQFDGRASVLGISLGIETVRLGPHEGDERTAVAVMDLQPGFPAAEVLRVGDRILMINNEPLPSDMTIESFRQHVNTAQPGTVIQLRVLRGRQQVAVSVRLAGVPEEGALAIQQFVHWRSAAAKAYLDQLHCRPEVPLVIRTPEDVEPAIPAAPFNKL
jgi:hypothetical protein